MAEEARAGRRPKRTIVFASWDAEEFTLTSSTEWGEEHRDKLLEHAVAYLNFDSAASGPQFDLHRVVADEARAVIEPAHT